ncbi:MAG: [FeFe] hydrogenase H-cluster maturation GTPase HydF, partial [Sedimentisphaerales bacterium]|nr:[FeFe] hydrogenase H-cluster maturation GTPase HydF [Sedimentisphaerales bacterium]
MEKTPKSLRLHIGIFGRRNVGKSSLLNALTRQQVSIISDVAGTTTDPVEKPMELLPLGPVLFIDTAGVDDVGDLGQLRIQRTRQIFDRTDLGIIVTEAGVWGDFETAIHRELNSRNIPLIIVINKCDLHPSIGDLPIAENNIPVIQTVASKQEGMDQLRQAIIRQAPEEFIDKLGIIGDIIHPGDLALLVVPIDLEAPKGRLIVPQVQTLRDILDNDAYAVVVKEHQLPDALARLNRPPALVVTDSQAFGKVAADTPADVPLTSFSILFARFKGDLREFVRGAAAVDGLKPGDNILIAESCSHHPIGDDIGRIKIPHWLTRHVGGKLNFTTVQGHDFPENLGDYQLVVQCGGCMHNRRTMLSRIIRCRQAGVPITNYGVLIAKIHGILPRA